MAGIADAMRSILGQLATITVANGDGNAITPYIRVWNNQLHLIDGANTEMYPLPALFLEIQNSPDYQSIGQGVHGADLLVKIHIVHEYYNSTDGTYLQDLAVFDLRDSIVALLNLWSATGTGPFDFSGEHQDYSHTNLYHMEVDFKVHFIDYKGSKLDPAANYYKYTTPPIDTAITATKTVGGAPVQRKFIMPGQNS